MREHFEQIDVERVGHLVGRRRAEMGPHLSERAAGIVLLELASQHAGQ